MRFREAIQSIVLACICLFVGSNYYYLSPFYRKTTKAIAVIHPTQGNEARGVVKFSEEKNGMHIVADISNLTPGTHGFHIHEFGDCACPDANCAGGHYNPTKQPHGGPHDKKRHSGDLGNIEADVQGNAHIDLIDDVITLNGRHSIIGRSVIIHEKADDFISQPSGDAGARIGCGVIGIGKDGQ